MFEGLVHGGLGDADLVLPAHAAGSLLPFTPAAHDETALEVASPPSEAVQGPSSSAVHRSLDRELDSVAGLPSALAASTASAERLPNPRHSTVYRLLPRTPHFAAIAAGVRGGTGSVDSDGEGPASVHVGGAAEAIGMLPKTPHFAAIGMRAPAAVAGSANAEGEAHERVRLVCQQVVLQLDDAGLGGAGSA